MRMPSKWAQEWNKHKKEIENRLGEFSRVPKSEYFYELCFCILTPQSKAKNADKVVGELKRDKFYERGFDPTPYLRNPKNYIRFHNTKSKRLLNARRIFTEIEQKIAKTDSPAILREELLALIPGLGMKESSHFLRNIGFRGLAIIDRHILKNLKELSIISEIPKSISKKRYLDIEKKWSKSAKGGSPNFDEQDLLFWSMKTGEVRK